MTVDTAEKPHTGDPLTCAWIDECGECHYCIAVLAVTNYHDQKLIDVETALNGFTKRVTDFGDSIQPYLDQVGPMITALENSPIFRAALGIKKGSRE